MPAIFSFSPLGKNAMLDAIAAEWANGVIHGFGGVPVADTVTDPGTDILIKFTKDGEAFTPGVSTNGINLGTAALGVIHQDANEYKGEGLVAGTLSWFRHYNNDLSAWIQGTVGTSNGTVMTVTTTIVTVGGPIELVDIIYRFRT